MEGSLTGFNPLDAHVVLEVNPSLPPQGPVNSHFCPDIDGLTWASAFGYFQYNGEGQYLNIFGDFNRAVVVYIDNVSVNECFIDICQPIPDFTYTLDGCTAIFNGINTGDPGVYTWDFGDSQADNGEVVKHTFIEDGTYEACLILNCSETRSELICKEITIDSDCGQCNLNEIPVTAHLCEIDSTYTTELNFDFFSGLEPCSSTVPSFWSNDTQIEVNSFIPTTNGLITSVSAGVTLTPYNQNDFATNGAKITLIVCDENGNPSCYNLTVLPKSCDSCEDVLSPLYLNCDPNKGNDTTSVFTGDIVITTPVNNLTLDKEYSDNINLDLTNVQSTSPNQWTLSYTQSQSIFNSNKGGNSLVVFKDGNTPPTLYCFRFPTVIAQDCPTIIDTCGQYWTNKKVFCSYTKDGEMIFRLGTTSIPIPTGYEICDFGLIIDVEGGYANINSENPNNGNLLFNADLHFPSDIDLNNDVLVKVIFCGDGATDFICQGISYNLECGSNESSPKIVIKEEKFELETLTVYPNPVMDLLKLSFTNDIDEYKSLKMYDQTGKVIKNIDLSSKKNEIIVSTTDISPGLYILILESKSGELETDKIIVIK